MSGQILTRWLSGMDLPSSGHTGQIVITGALQQPFTESTIIYAGITLKVSSTNVGTVSVFQDSEDAAGWPLSIDGSPEMFELKDISDLRLRGTNAGDIVYYRYS